jgi:hypothetical protein
MPVDPWAPYYTLTGKVENGRQSGVPENPFNFGQVRVLIFNHLGMVSFIPGKG